MSKQLLRGTNGNAELNGIYSHECTSGSIWGDGPPVWFIIGPDGFFARNDGREQGWSVGENGSIIVPTDPEQAPLGTYGLEYYDNYVYDGHCGEGIPSVDQSDYSFEVVLVITEPPVGPQPPSCG